MKRISLNSTVNQLRKQLKYINDNWPSTLSAPNRPDAIEYFESQLAKLSRMNAKDKDEFAAMANQLKDQLDDLYYADLLIMDMQELTKLKNITKSEGAHIESINSQIYNFHLYIAQGTSCTKQINGFREYLHGIQEPRLVSVLAKLETDTKAYPYSKKTEAKSKLVTTIAGLNTRLARIDGNLNDEHIPQRESALKVIRAEIDKLSKQASSDEANERKISNCIDAFVTLDKSIENLNTVTLNHPWIIEQVESLKRAADFQYRVMAVYEMPPPSKGLNEYLENVKKVCEGEQNIELQSDKDSKPSIKENTEKTIPLDMTPIVNSYQAIVIDNTKKVEKSVDAEQAKSTPLQKIEDIKLSATTTKKSADAISTKKDTVPVKKTANSNTSADSKKSFIKAGSFAGASAVSIAGAVSCILLLASPVGLIVGIVLAAVALTSLLAAAIYVSKGYFARKKSTANINNMTFIDVTKTMEKISGAKASFKMQASKPLAQEPKVERKEEKGKKGSDPGKEQESRFTR